jgi:hypothetical protein
MVFTPKISIPGGFPETRKPPSPTKPRVVVGSMPAPIKKIIVGSTPKTKTIAEPTVNIKSTHPPQTRNLMESFANIRITNAPPVDGFLGKDSAVDVYGWFLFILILDPFVHHSILPTFVDFSTSERVESEWETKKGKGVGLKGKFKFWSGMLVSKGFLEFGVLKNRVGESWNVASDDGTKAVISTNEFTSLVTRKSESVLWTGDCCQYCRREIDSYDMVLPRLGVHDYVGNSNCPHKFHLSCIAPKFSSLLDRGSKRKCSTCGVGWKVCDVSSYSF